MDSSGGGLSFGFTYYHFKILCTNSWEGGLGMSPREVALLTPDQAAFLLVDAKRIKSLAGGVSKMPAQGLSSVADDDGLIKVRLADGTLARVPMRNPQKDSPAKSSKRRRRKRGN